VERLLATNPQRWPVKALAYSAVSRARVTEVWEQTRPAVLIHGHMHLADQVRLPGEQQVISLGCDDAPRNIGVLALEALEWTWCSEPAVPDE
jgi:Icc-related predicted phosphoesterase